MRPSSLHSSLRRYNDFKKIQIPSSKSVPFLLSLVLQQGPGLLLLSPRSRSLVDDGDNGRNNRHLFPRLIFLSVYLKCSTARLPI